MRTVVFLLLLLPLVVHANWTSCDMDLFFAHRALARCVSEADFWHKAASFYNASYESAVANGKVAAENCATELNLCKAIGETRAAFRAVDLARCKAAKQAPRKIGIAKTFFVVTLIGFAIYGMYKSCE